MKDYCTNWLQVLERQAELSPNNIALTQYIKGNERDIELSYLALSQRAKALAYSISQQSKLGDRVIILLPNSIDYVVSFFACIYAGVIAVPAYPPHKKKRDWARLNCIVQDCEPSIAIYHSSDHEPTDLWLSEHPLSVNTIICDHLDIGTAEHWQEPAIDLHDIAYLQYSSGSTGNPKGVMLSHDNLIKNTELIIKTYGMTESDKLVNWLPLYHDMGFVGGILTPIRVGAQTRLLPSAMVAQNPYLLFEAITEQRSTGTAAPNFIFDLAVSRISPEEKQQLDLSSLRIFVNGAEPINADTLNKFNAYFHDTGLSPNTIKPSYGMAESCLLVTSTEIDKPFNTIKVDPQKLSIGKVIHENETGKDIACSGALMPEIAVNIVDQNTRIPLPNSYIGEIMIKGDSVTRGYWQKADLNVQTFDLAVGNEHGFMATGDLGFIENNQLYVTGRIKEVLIINGCNYYPQDIEHSLLSLSDSLMPHGAAIFEVNTDNNAKEIVLVQELTRKALKQKDYQTVIKQIREVVAQEHELKLTTVVLLKPIALAKTSSGKIQRIACRDAYINKQLAIVDSWHQEAMVNAIMPSLTAHDTNTIAQWIIQWISYRLSVATSKLSITQQLTQIGLDSIDAMTLTHDLSKQLKLTLTPEVSWSHPSIKALSEYLAQQVSDKNDKPLVSKTPTQGMI
ncbi:MAG: AMP-binding protein [Alteromonadaceae bacterium]|nr:AMP-binding protein [Alteromonadaceae bacterium]